MVVTQDWFDDPQGWDLPAWMFDEEDRLVRDPEDPDEDEEGFRLRD